MFYFIVLMSLVLLNTLKVKECASKLLTGTVRTNEIIGTTCFFLFLLSCKKKNCWLVLKRNICIHCKIVNIQTSELMFHRPCGALVAHLAQCVPRIKAESLQQQPGFEYSPGHLLFVISISPPGHSTLNLLYCQIKQNKYQKKKKQSVTSFTNNTYHLFSQSLIYWS